MSEWKGDDRHQSLTIGEARANAWVGGALGIYLTIERRTDSMDAAKSAAEQALREMHDALAAHFAPVLRWYRCGDQCDASVGGWMLLACSGSWVIKHELGARVASDPSCSLTSEQSCRAAEAALRELGVVFRVEGE